MSSMEPPEHEPLIQHILVPQGAEYQAVMKGLKRGLSKERESGRSPQPNVHTIPIGPQATWRHLMEAWTEGDRPTAGSRVVLMGLGGSLSPELTVGDVVIVEACDYMGKDFRTSGSSGDRPNETVEPPLKSDPMLLTSLQQRLGSQAIVGRGLTGDRLISSAAEKQQLGNTHGALVVDMEGYGVMALCQALQLPCAVVRVISDDCSHDIPDVSAAIDAEGNLRALPLALHLALHLGRHPLAALRLIRGSLQGLRQLERVATRLV